MIVSLINVRIVEREFRKRGILQSGLKWISCVGVVVILDFLFNGVGLFHVVLVDK